MARPLRPLVADGIYHVFNRGNARQRIFEDEGDCDEFLRRLRHARKLCGWSYLAYCLLKNHYHLVVRTPRPNLAVGMRHVNSGYAQAFNRRHDRCGHLFQGRYGSRLVQSDEHFLTVLRYVALNPVEAGFCALPDEWPRTGHHELVGRAPADIVDVSAVLELIDERPGRALSAYRELIRTDAAAPPLVARGDVVIGDQPFAAAAVASAVVSSEMPKRQRVAGRPDLNDVFAADRRDALNAAYYEHGYSQREIADHLGCHYATVSRWLRESR